ncbi:MAG: zinc transporter ZntB [Pseudomonadota bacterium]|nr:zinc transporter ZntB [Pseudomonadota bacterium]
MADLANEAALLSGFEVRGRRSAALSWEAIKDGYSPAADGYAWIALNRHQEEAREWLRQHSRIPPLAVAALLAEETRPRMLRIGEGSVVILRGVNLNPGAAPEDMVSVRFWFDAQRVISVQLRRLKALSDTRRLLDQPETTPETAGGLLASIAVRLVERMEPVINDYRDKTDDLEEESIDRAGKDMRSRLGRLRRDAIILRRYIAPQRDVLNALAADPLAPFDDRTRLELRETSDRVTRLVEDLEAVRDRASVVSDQIVDQRAEEMNRNMMILSVVAAVFLPLGFLTGLLGINVGGMPGADNPVAFWVVVFLCILLGGGLAVYFNRKGWL